MSLRARSLALLVPALLAAHSVAAGAVGLPAGTTAIVSGDASLLAPLPEPVAGAMGFDPFAERGSVSADGRYVVFVTNVPALGASTAVQEQFVRRDMVTGATVPVSVTSAGAPMPLSINSLVDFFPGTALSADGNRFVFEAPGQSGAEQIWVRDIAAGTTTLASVERLGGGESLGIAFSPSISADGNRVAFGSNADDLVAGDTGGDFDVFVRDLAARTTILASAADQGAAHGGTDGVISRDGDHVAFQSSADNLVPGDANGISDVFVRDLTPGRAPRTRRASVSGSGAGEDRQSGEPAVSADGSRVAFVSEATDFGVPIPQGATPQVWVHDFADGSTVLASATLAGAAAGDGVLDQPPALSADGRVVAFTSDSPDLVPNGHTTVQLYRRDLAGHATQVVSRGQGPNGNPSSDVHQNPADPSITADGGCVTFEGDPDLLGPGVLNPSVYMRVLEPDCGRPVAVPPPPFPPPPGSPNPPPPPPRDTTAPLLRAVSLSHSRFAPGAPPHRGTTLRFTTSEAGRLTLTIEHVLPGRKVGRTCRPVLRPVKRGRCTILRRTTTLTRTVKAGRATLALSGRTGTRPFAPGAYRLTLTVRDAAGNVSKPARRAFAVVAGRADR